MILLWEDITSIVLHEGREAGEVGSYLSIKGALSTFSSAFMFMVQ